LGHLRRIEVVDDESSLLPITDELLRHGERQKGPTTDTLRVETPPEQFGNPLSKGNGTTFAERPPHIAAIPPSPIESICLKIGLDDPNRHNGQMTATTPRPGSRGLRPRQYKYAPPAQDFDGFD
jgi:hypothetical protein